MIPPHGDSLPDAVAAATAFRHASDRSARYSFRHIAWSRASAVASTAGANASAGTTGGGQTGISGGEKDAKAMGSYSKGVAIFTIAKGGLMGQATVGGQKFSYTPVP